MNIKSPAGTLDETNFEVPSDVAFTDVPAPKTGNLSKMHQRVLDAKAQKEAPKVADNTFWDEANAAYEQAYSLIISSNQQVEGVVSSFLSEPEIAQKLDNDVALAEQIQLLTRDIQDTLAKLTNIRTRHVGRTGGVTEPEELGLVMSINGEYKEVLDIYHANITPSVIGILEKTGVLEAELNEIRAKRAAAVPAQPH